MLASVGRPSLANPELNEGLLNKNGAQTQHCPGEEGTASGKVCAVFGM